ncbi:MAG: sugar nucleotide-binding protein [Candidatus Omnitrophica bacterium]|nr:sugar nucleotide-binding protein [Candidatus Omnitrophota bacterium]
MRREILILGKGFIGNRLKEFFKCSISDKRIHSFRDMQKEIKRFDPRIVINCIGHTGSNVDECEFNKDKTLLANTFLPIILTEVALRNNIKLVHISSGCVYYFDYHRDRPIPEEKIPDFFELFYSRAKIYAERALEVLCQRFNILIVRPRLPLDNRPHYRNLLTKLIQYKRVIDIPNSVTYIPDFMEALRHLIRIDARGIYNVVNRGVLRYPELLEVYRKYVPDFQYEIIDPKRLNLKRTNLILSTKKLEKSGFKLRDIREVLEECVKEYIRY